MNINILIVDDIEANLFSLEGLIDELGIEEKQEINVMKSLSGEEALKIARNSPIDLIVLDVQMPVMDGFEVAKFLKSNTKTKDIPIIFLTAAFISEEFVRNGFDVGAIDYFIKPIEKPIFVNKIKLYIALALKGKQLEESEKQLKLLNTSLEQRVQGEVEKNRKKDQLMIAQSRHAAMGEMIGMIAHQWRQPLQIINMNVNNTLVDIDFEKITMENLHKYSESILTQTEHLTKTIDDFKNFFSPNQEKEDILILSVIEETNSIIGSSLISSSIVLNISCSSNIKASIYKRELVQVILNLINNSKYAIVNNNIENGHIDIEVSEEDNWIILKVSDNGGGISNESIEKIFEPYFTTKGVSSGTGLGLHISKTIVETHFHGTIEVFNIDGGVCFEIKIPKIEGELK